LNSLIDSGVIRRTLREENLIEFGKMATLRADLPGEAKMQF